MKHISHRPSGRRFGSRGRKCPAPPGCFGDLMSGAAAKRDHPAVGAVAGPSRCSQLTLNARSRPAEHHLPNDLAPA